MHLHSAIALAVAVPLVGCATSAPTPRPGTAPLPRAASGAGTASVVPPPVGAGERRAGSAGPRPHAASTSGPAARRVHRVDPEAALDPPVAVTNPAWAPPSGSGWLDEHGGGDASAAVAEDGERWSSFLPFYADHARAQGYDLPLPFGVGVNLIFVDRPTEVDNVRAGVNGGALQDVNFATVAADASVAGFVTRFDAWLLPVLNVYVLGGYVWADTDVEVVADLPGFPGTAFRADVALDGPTYGAGVTFVGGYRELFVLFDYNTNRIDLGGLSSFDANLSTFRVGWNTDYRGAPLQVWTGASYWDTARTITGSIQTGGALLTSIDFQIDQAPEDPWTALVGASLMVREEYMLLLEYQAWEGTSVLVTGITYRF